MHSHNLRVKYYSKNDMSIGWNLEKAEKIINAFNYSDTNHNINYILELYNICLLFDSEARLKSWNEEYYQGMKVTVNEFKSIIGLYYSKIDYSKIDSFFTSISVYYHDNFWNLFAYYKIYEKVSSTEFSNILKKFNVPLRLILVEKMIVETFDREISEYMRDSKSTAVILLTHHLAINTEKSKKYYIPKSLGKDNQISIIEKYVESEEANPNYLQLLYKSRITKEFPISDEIRLKSKK